MRALLPVSDEHVDLHSFYADGWSRDGGLRANFVSSIDGAVSLAGLSAGLQTPGDNRVFAVLRDLADVVLAGAGTARAEGYAAIDLSPQRRAVRREHGMREVLPTAIVSRSLRLDPTTPLFTAAVPEARTVVLTCSAADADLRSALEGVADVVICGEESVDLVAARTALEQRGLSRILCEGGPSLFADLARAGVVDELCLSITPLLAGPGPGRISTGPPWTTAPLPVELAGLLEEDGALFLRLRNHRR